MTSKIGNNHCNNCLSVSFSLWADLTRNVKLTLKISKLGKFSGLYEWNSIILYSGISSSFDKIVAKMAKTFQWNKISSKIGLLAKTSQKWPTFLTNVPKLPKIENSHCNSCLSVSFSLWADLTRNVKLTLKNKQIRQI